MGNKVICTHAFFVRFQWALLISLLPSDTPPLLVCGAHYFSAIYMYIDICIRYLLIRGFFFVHVRGAEMNYE